MVKQKKTSGRDKYVRFDGLKPVVWRRPPESYQSPAQKAAGPL